MKQVSYPCLICGQPLVAWLVLDNRLHVKTQPPFVTVEYHRSCPISVDIAKRTQAAITAHFIPLEPTQETLL